MPFDPGSLAMEMIPQILNLSVGSYQNKKIRKANIRNQYVTDVNTAQQETKSFLDDARYRSLAGGGNVGSLAPAMNQLLTNKLQDLRAKRERELRAL